VTLVPVLMGLFVKGRIRPERANPLNRWAAALYRPVLRWALRWRLPVLGTATVLVAVTMFPLRRLGSEFMPPLNEGTLLYMPTGPPGISITEASRVLQLMDRELKRFPEVERVFGKIGRAETPTDPAPLSMVETIVTLKPRDQWRAGLGWDELVEELDQALDFPGMPNLWWMPIQTRTEMLATGFRSRLGIKVFGPDAASIEQASTELERVLEALPTTRSAVAERLSGGFYLDIRTDRDAVALPRPSARKPRVWRPGRALSDE